MKIQDSKALLVLFIGLLTFSISCSTKEDLSVSNADSYDANVVHKWYDKMLEITPQTSGFTPNVVARAMAYTGLALYESMAFSQAEYASLSGRLNGFERKVSPDANYTYYAPAMANAALASIIKNLYGNMSAANVASVAALETEIAASFEGKADIATLTRSKNYGRKIAEEVFEWSETDGGNKAYFQLTDPSFVPVSGPGKWRVTTPLGAALHPHWGENRPFMVDNVTNSQPSGAKVYSTASNSAFYMQAKEVYTTSQTLTDEQKVIARYWADELGSITSPGHSIAILKSILVKEDANFATVVEAYCKLGIGLNDAYIACWKCKYNHNLLRPVTYIKEVINPAWNPLVTTPLSPEYTSERAIQASVMGNMLTHWFGENYAFVDLTHEGRVDIDGSPRSFISFDDASHEAAFSGLYGGTHFRDAIIIGLTQGKIIAENINDMPFKR